MASDDTQTTQTLRRRLTTKGLALFGHRPVVRLRVLVGENVGHVYEASRTRVAVGRSRNADITVPDSTMSGLHFEIVGGKVLRDLGSHNGTSLVWRADGTKRIYHVELVPGDVVLAGSSRLEFMGAEQARVELYGAAEFHGLLGTSPQMRGLFAAVQAVAGRSSVLIEGEIGTEKDRVAYAYHVASGGDGPFHILRCASVPAVHAKNAFEEVFKAATGTLVLDEIAELTPENQRLLLGCVESVPACMRVVATTHRDLRRQVAGGTFVDELLLALGDTTLSIPPLRDRPEDIPLLALHFAEESRSAAGKGVVFDDRALHALSRYSWPGNTRELERVVNRAILACHGSHIHTEQLALSDVGPSQLVQEVEEMIRHGVGYMEIHDLIDLHLFPRVIDAERGNMTKVAARLKIERGALRSRLGRLEKKGLYVVDKKHKPNKGH